MSRRRPFFNYRRVLQPKIMGMGTTLLHLCSVYNLKVVELLPKISSLLRYHLCQLNQIVFLIKAAVSQLNYHSVLLELLRQW
jgi:hypothetical protein